MIHYQNLCEQDWNMARRYSSIVATHTPVRAPSSEIRARENQFAPRSAPRVVILLRGALSRSNFTTRRASRARWTQKIFENFLKKKFFFVNLFQISVRNRLIIFSVGISGLSPGQSNSGWDNTCQNHYKGNLSDSGKYYPNRGYCGLVKGQRYLLRI